MHTNKAMKHGRVQEAVLSLVWNRTYYSQYTGTHSLIVTLLADFILWQQRFLNVTKYGEKFGEKINTLCTQHKEFFSSKQRIRMIVSVSFTYIGFLCLLKTPHFRRCIMHAHRTFQNETIIYQQDTTDIPFSLP